MKKTVIIIFSLFVLGFSVDAQDYRTSAGLRAGFPYGVTVKHFLNETNALEGILASSWGGFVVTGLYENVHWTGEYPGLNWFWGFGAHLGFWGTRSNFIDDPGVGSILGADLVLGLEYTFDEIPLNLSLDVMPSVNLLGYTGWNGVQGGLSIRYVF